MAYCYICKTGQRDAEIANHIRLMHPDEFDDGFDVEIVPLDEQ